MVSTHLPRALASDSATSLLLASTLLRSHPEPYPGPSVSCHPVVRSEHVPVRATLPSALNMMNASPVGKLVQLVTASRLILYHKGRVDPMKDGCHYQIKH